MASVALALVLALLTPAGANAGADTLRGTVRTTAGAAVGGATVLLHAAGRTQTTTTAGDGSFTFADAALPAQLEVVARGFLTLRTAVNASAVEITLSTGDVRESVVVSGAVMPEYLPSPRTITRQDIEAIPAAAPDETLRAVSGFSLFRRSPARASNPTTHGVTMRGLSASGASRALVLLDGVPLNDGFGGWVTWTRVPMLALTAIDVERGAAGGTFGTDALGGVFELRAGADAEVTRVRVDAGSNALASVDASAARKVRTTSLFAAAGFFRTDGVIPLAAESRGAVDAPADAEWFNVLGKAAIHLGRTQLVVSGWGGRDDRGNGTRLQRNRMTGGTFAASIARPMDQGHIAARLSLSPNSFDQTFTAVAAQRVTETLTSTQRVESTAWRTLVEYARGIPRGIIIGRAAVSRASADFVDVRPTSTADQSLDDNGEALSLHAGIAPAGSVSLAGGVRHEWRAAPEASSDRERATVGQASASWQPRSDLVVRASGATSHRWPTLNELVRNFQVGAILTLANPDLRPERARSADVSVAFTRARWTASATMFTSIVRNAIANVTQTPTRRQRQNAGDAHATGVEIETGLRPMDALRVRMSAAFSDATFEDSAEPALEGKRLPQVPRASFALAADASLPFALRASAFLRTIGAQYDDDRNAFELAGATQLDVQLAGDVRALTWRVMIENATDARVEVGRTPLVTLAPGRALRLGIGVRF